MIRYLVAYSYNGGTTVGFGSVDVEVVKPFKNRDEVFEAAVPKIRGGSSGILASGKMNVTIMGFTRYE